jgi:hypothetical protein
LGSKPTRRRDDPDSDEEIEEATVSRKIAGILDSSGKIIAIFTLSGSCQLPAIAT